MSEVADAIRTFPIIYDITQRELYRKVLDDLKNGIVKEIDTDLYEAYGNGLRKAVDTVLGESEYGDEYFDMQMQMRANVSRFAAYKAYHATQELKDVDPADIDKKGKLILNKYNRWQAAEYNTAVARTRTAKQYHDFTSDPISNELYPNIKWLPSRSASPREAHRVFWNRVWAKNDPFWNSNTPGSLWNCKCDWEETDEPVTDKNPNGTMSSKGLDGNPAVTGKVFTDDCPYVKKGGKIVADFWEPIEQHHNDYLKYLKDTDYHDVDFNWNGGMKATHNEHNFDPKKGHYEKDVCDVGFNNGHSVIFTSEFSNIIYKKFTEGLWDNKKFEIAGCETATTNNVLRGLKHCASKRETDIAVIYYPKGGFDQEVFNKAVERYKGLEPKQDGQYLKFDKIICVENNEIVFERSHRGHCREPGHRPYRPPTPGTNPAHWSRSRRRSNRC